MGKQVSCLSYERNSLNIGNQVETVRRALLAVGVIVLLLFLLAQSVQSRPEGEVTEKPEAPKEETEKPKEENQKDNPQPNKPAEKPVVVDNVQPKPAVKAVVKSGATGPLTAAQLDFLWKCESSRTPNINTGNGYYGGFQFDIPTWHEVNSQYPRADLAPHEVQVAAVQKLLSYSSIWDRFPGCAVKMREAGLL